MPHTVCAEFSQYYTISHGHCVFCVGEVWWLSVPTWRSVPSSSKWVWALWQVLLWTVVFDSVCLHCSGLGQIRNHCIWLGVGLRNKCKWKLCISAWEKIEVALVVLSPAAPQWLASLILCPMQMLRLLLLQLGQDSFKACAGLQIFSWASRAVWTECTYTHSCVPQSCCCCLFSLTLVSHFCRNHAFLSRFEQMEHVETLCIFLSATSFPWISSWPLRWWKLSGRTCSCYSSLKLHVSSKACFNFCSTCFIKVGSDGYSDWTVCSCTAG